MLKSFHDTWYAPNNAILVIAGDLDPVATLSEVKLLFGDIRAKKLPPKPQVRLRPVRPTSFTLDTDRPSGTLMIALRTPDRKSTRLNSSHSQISYAVFCLKKKKNKHSTTHHH